MKIRELKEKVNKIPAEFDDLDAVVQDPNEATFYALNGIFRTKLCDKKGYECDEDSKNAEKVFVL